MTASQNLMLHAYNWPRLCENAKRPEFGGPSTPTEVGKIEYRAIYEVGCVWHSGVSEFSHSLGRERSFSIIRV